MYTPLTQRAYARRGGGRLNRRGGGASAPSSLRDVMARLVALYPQTRWWDADTGVATSGANVTSWTDRLQSEALTPPGTAPTYGAWWGEGRNAVAFNGASPLDNASSALAALLGGSQKSTIITFAEPQAWDGTNFSTLFAATGSTASRYEIMMGVSGTQTTSYRTPGGALAVTAAQGQQVRAAGYDGTNLKANHNASKVATVAAGANVTLSRIVMGGSYQSSAYINQFTGLIRHVIVVPGAYLPTEQSVLWSRLVAALRTETTKLRVVGSRGMAMSGISGTSITRSESRVRCYTRGAATGVRLVFPSYYLAPAYTKPGNSFTVTAGIEYNGVFYPATFRGASSRVVAPTDQLVVTDAITDLPANATFYVRSGAACTLGQQIPVGFDRINPAYAAHDQCVSTNGGASQVSGTGAMSESGSYAFALAYGPVAIIGLPTVAQPQCIIVGDSIVRSNDWDGDSSLQGWLQIGMHNGGRTPFASYDRGGSALSNFATATNPHAYIVAQWSQNKAVVCLGRNSLPFGLATVQSQATDIIDGLREQGCSVYWCLVPPQSTSTDTWATLANQTISGTETVRQQFHTWLASLVGTSLVGTVNALQYVESAAETGKWIPLATNDGIHPGISGLSNDTIHQQMSASMQAIASGW